MYVFKVKRTCPMLKSESQILAGVEMYRDPEQVNRLQRWLVSLLRGNCHCLVGSLPIAQRRKERRAVKAMPLPLLGYVATQVSSEHPALGVTVSLEETRKQQLQEKKSEEGPTAGSGSRIHTQYYLHLRLISLLHSLIGLKLRVTMIH